MPPQRTQNAVPISRHEIKVASQSEGVSNLIWLGQDMGNGMLKGLCPVKVTSDASTP